MLQYLASLYSKLVTYSLKLKTMNYLVELVCVFVLSYTTYASLQKGPLLVQPQPPPVAFFPQNSTVPDFYQGSIVQPFTETVQSDVSVILYYAPWDFDSQLFRQEFLETAQEFGDDIYFTAINCWTFHGECREQFPSIRSFPMVFVYIRGYKGIQYRGPLVSGYLTHFLRSVLYPLKHLKNKADLHSLRSAHDAVIVGYFNFTKNIPAGFNAFYMAALKYLETDPYRSTVFAVVTSTKTAKDLKLRENVSSGWDIRYYLWNETLIYPNTNSKIDIDRFVNWVSYRYQSPIQWLAPNGRKSALLQTALHDSGKPSLVLFTNRLQHMQKDYLLVKEVALNYWNCKTSARISQLAAEIRQQLQEVETGRKKVKANLENLRCALSQRNVTIGSTVFGPQLLTTNCQCESIEESISSPVQGFGCKTNHSLDFYAMDSGLYSYYATSLGINSLRDNPDNSVAVIIDSQDESTFVLPGQLSTGLLENFINNFSRRSLKRHRRSANETESKPCKNGEICIEEVSTDNYESVVLRKDSDVVILYRKPNCVFCDSAAHVFLKAASVLGSESAKSGGPKIKFVTINGEQNDLPWHLSVDRYPTIVFFPAYRKSESRAFPHEKQLDITNLLQFVVSQLTPHQQLFYFLESCTSDSCLREASLRNQLRMTEISKNLRRVKSRLHYLRKRARAETNLRRNSINSLEYEWRQLEKERHYIVQMNSNILRLLSAMERKQREDQLDIGILRV